MVMSIRQEKLELLAAIRCGRFTRKICPQDGGHANPYNHLSEDPFEPPLRGLPWPTPVALAYH